MMGCSILIHGREATAAAVATSLPDQGLTVRTAVSPLSPKAASAPLAVARPPPRVSFSVHQKRGCVLSRAVSQEGNSFNFDPEELGRPAQGWTFDEPKDYYFAVANAQSLICDGALLEEVLRDGISRAERGGRPRDVWMVVEPSFLDHPALAGVRARVSSPTAAVITTNGQWMLTTVRELVPQAIIGKFSAPTAAIPNPLKSKLNPEDAFIGDGFVWH
eukprot:TRINITY_DN6131_c0_g1_i4.p1 TRINITY_DN6131_c0_g1~~TRINITY_DN6131_c0_g1_i4.p1  ORF type:complete len:218 (-),score=45.15 TRINITY_DN6131_c0_g1_i4:310-963(-)